VTKPNPDPWNWGWEESGITENSEPNSNSSSSSSSNIINNNNKNNSNNNLDPSWGWSIDSTATYQEHNIPNTNAGYSSGCQNYTIAPTHETFNTEQNTTVMSPSTAALIAESFSSGSADQTTLFHNAGTEHLEGNRNTFTLNYLQNDTKSHPIATSVNQYATVNTASDFNEGIYSHRSLSAEINFEQGHVNNVHNYQQETCRASTDGERIMDSTAVTHDVKNTENVKEDTLQLSADYVRGDEGFMNVPAHTSDTKAMMDIKEELNSPTDDLPELSRESSTREQDTNKQIFSVGNDGLSSQWSTESLPSSEELSQTVEGNGMVSSHSSVPQSLFVVDTLQINEQNDQYQNFEHGTYSFNDVQQGGIRIEGADEAQSLQYVSDKTSVSESRNLCPEEYQNYYSDAYGVEQTTNEAVTWKQDTGNGGYRLVDTSSNACGHMSVGSNISTSFSNLYVHGDVYTTEPESMTDVAHLSTDTIKTLSVESVASALDSLAISNENLRSRDVENKEIIYPEIEENSGVVLPSSSHNNQSAGSNVKLIPPPAVPGPPLNSTGITQRKNSNPYSLNQKHTNKYRISPHSGEGEASGSDQRNYSHQPISSVGPLEAGVNISQFGTLPEIMSHAVNNVMQPTYSHTAVETPGNLVSRKKNTPPPPVTEDAVNMETVPDNKERPDFIDVPQTAPVMRPHTTPVGQVSF
jgi:hypothetical protein